MLVWISSVLLLALLLVLVRWGYRRAPCHPLPAAAPALVVFPKYCATVVLPRSVRASARPAQALAALLRAHGFGLHGGEDFPLLFRRDRMPGRLSIVRPDLRLMFGEPAGYSDRCELILLAGRPVLFDTGDMWRVFDAVKRDLERDAMPRWGYGVVAADIAHIQIRDGETRQLLARVAPLDGAIRVQPGEGLAPGSERLPDAVVRQLDFYFGEKQEPDPWCYAIHHCSTAANLYSPVRWSFVAARRSED